MSSIIVESSLFLSKSSLSYLRKSWHFMGLFLLTSTRRLAATGGMVCQVQTNVLTSFVQKLMPVPLRRSLGRLLSRTDSLLEDWSSKSDPSFSAQRQQRMWILRTRAMHTGQWLLKLYIPLLSISFAAVAFVVVSEFSESGSEVLPVRSRWEPV